MEPARKATVVVENHLALGVGNTVVIVVVDPLSLWYFWVALASVAYPCAGPQLFGSHMVWVVLWALVYVEMGCASSHYLLGWILLGSFVHSVLYCCCWMRVVEANHQPSSVMG